MNEKSGYLILFFIVSTERFIFQKYLQRKEELQVELTLTRMKKIKKIYLMVSRKKVSELLACGEWNMHCVHTSN